MWGRNVYSLVRPVCHRKRERRQPPWRANRTPSVRIATGCVSGKRWKPVLWRSARSLRWRRRRPKPPAQRTYREKRRLRRIAKRCPVAARLIWLRVVALQPDVEESDEKISKDEGAGTPQFARD